MLVGGDAAQDEQVGALEFILQLAAVAAFFGGVVGLIRPHWVRLPSRWAAAALFWFSGVPIGAKAQFYPEPDKAADETALISSILMWALTCAFIIFIRIGVAAQRYVTAPPSQAAGFVDELAIRWANFARKFRSNRARSPVSMVTGIPEWSQAQQTFANSAERHHTLELAIGNKRVTPPIPTSRKPVVPPETDEIITVQRDHSSGWSAYIRYIDAKSQISERRIVVRRVEGRGQSQKIFAWCFERSAHRTFLVANVLELVCAETGEVLDPGEHFGRLVSEGAIGAGDKSLADLVTLLVFMARCDGEFHPCEMISIEEAIEQHVKVFKGDRKTITKMKANARRLAPDADDFLTAVENIRQHPQSKKLAQIALGAMDQLVRADGTVSDDEALWAEAVYDELEDIAAAPVAEPSRHKQTATDPIVNEAVIDHPDFASGEDFGEYGTILRRGTNGVPLSFDYANSAGEAKPRLVFNWVEYPKHVQGWCQFSGASLCFRKDRVQIWLSASDKELRAPKGRSRA